MIAGAIVKRVDALLNGKMYGEAVQSAQIMQKRFPDHPLTINTYYFESAALLAMKHFSKAREVMKKIIELNRSEQLSEIALYQIGDSYFFEQSLNAAITAYGQYHAKYPAGKFAARSLYMQGTCYISLTEPDFARAKEKYTQVVTNHPGYEDICMAKNYLAYCSNRLDDFNTALKFYNQVIATGGCDKKALDFAKEQREAIRASRL
jgi:TolA-binding protein